MMQQQEMSRVRLDELRGQHGLRQRRREDRQRRGDLLRPGDAAARVDRDRHGLLRHEARPRSRGRSAGHRRRADGRVREGPREGRAGHRRGRDLRRARGRVLVSLRNLERRRFAERSSAAADGRRDQAVTRSEEEIERRHALGRGGHARACASGSRRSRSRWTSSSGARSRASRGSAIDEPVGDHEFTEEQVEVPLHAESPSSRSRRSRRSASVCRRTCETERQTVQDELKKEHVEVEGDVEGSD